MQPYRDNYPQDEAVREEGDARFIGVNAKLQPEQLGQGMLAFARNCRFTYGTIQPRRGRYAAPWLHRQAQNALSGYWHNLPWGKIWGRGVFADPTSKINYIYLATANGVWRLQEANAPSAETLPSYAEINGPVYFVQAFGQLILTRGRYQSPLVLSTVGLGFSELIPLWAAASSYAAGAVVRYGPWNTPTSVTGANTGIVTVVCPAPHNLAPGQMVTISGAATAGYNGNFAATPVDPFTFTYNVGASLSTAGGTPVWSPMEYSWQAQSPAPPSGSIPGGAWANASSAAVSVAGTVTITTAAAHNLATGASVTIAGLSPSAYNGAWTVVVVSPTTFTYQAPAGLGSPTGAATWAVFTTVSSASESAGPIITITTAAAHGLSTGQTVSIQGASPSGYNGSFVVTVTGPTTFTYSPGSGSGAISGTVQWAVVLPAASAAAVADNVVTITTSGNHHLTTGQTVNIQGASPALYNGAFVVTVTASTTFTYPAPPDIGPITGTVQWQLAGWARYYQSTPNGGAAIYTGNRLLVPTAWLPGNITASGGSNTVASAAYGAKQDFLACSDILDPTTVTLSDEFRINQGSADELLALVAMGNGQVIALKDSSCFNLGGVTGDLSSLTLSQLPTNYGVVNPLAATATASDCVFVAPRRGVVSMALTATGDVQGVDLPLSDPIQPLIDRINWSMADLIRIAYLKNKLYVAVPLDAGTAEGADLRAGAVPYPGQTITIGHITIAITGNIDFQSQQYPIMEGAIYHWTPNPLAPNALGNQLSFEYLLLGGQGIGNETVFTYQGGGLHVNSLAGFKYPSTLKQVYQRTNNAVLVYDYLTRQWSGYDDGPDLAVAELLTFKVQGEDRLIVFTADGMASIYEDLEAGDTVRTNATTANGVLISPVQLEALSRGYNFQESGNAMAEVELIGQTSGATLNATIESPSGSVVTAIGQYTADPTLYSQPASAARWNPSNANQDGTKPFRMDYALTIPASGYTLPTTGAYAFNPADWVRRVRLGPLQARAARVRFKSQGWGQLSAITPAARPGQRRAGTLT